MTKTAATDLGREKAERAFESLGSSELGRRAREAAYTLVGLGVMGAQRANAATRDAVRRLGGDDATLDLANLRAKTKDLSESARRQFSTADDVLGGALARIEEALSPLGAHLPGAARDTVEKVRDAGRELHSQVRSLVVGEQASTASEPDTDTKADTAAKSHTAAKSDAAAKKAGADD